MSRVEVKTAISEDKAKKINLGKRFDTLTAGQELVFDIYCNKHGQNSVVASFPHDIPDEIASNSKELEKWINLNINPRKCIPSCPKFLLGIAPYYPLETEPRRTYERPKQELEFPE